MRSAFKTLVSFFAFLFAFFVPRFITEPVCCVETPAELRPICSLDCVEPGDVYNTVVWMKSICWLGFCFFPRYVGPYYEGEENMHG